MNESALDYLFGLELFGVKFGLDNMRTMVDALGHPERRYRSIHVGGTNGKGSVTAMVDTGLRAAGRRSARYTSPHLVSLNERFVIDGQAVSTGALEDAADHVRAIVQRLIAEGRLETHPTFFEVTTAVAFELFERAAVEIAVFEVGMGGRLDATNVVAPAVTAITSIGLDHQVFLGHTLHDIAGEKAGIIKAGVPVVVGRMADEASRVISAVARERGAPLIHSAEGCEVIDFGTRGHGGHQVAIRTPRRDYRSVDLGLAGAHQIDNARVAVCVLEAMDDAGLAVPIEAVRHGLSAVRWPGRLDRRVMADGTDVLMDAAHNPDGARALAEFLEADSGAPRVLVFAAMRDKEATSMLDALMPAVSALVVTRASNPRSADPDELARLARQVDSTVPVLVEPSVPAALETAARRSSRIVIAGSIFLLGDVMERLGWS